ncbi:prepilin-type N-terminal cleavage/methylation domain-containing protein [Halomonas sp. DWK9]|uniref:PilW family protein n=1 Tax=Halomonas sp. DWK9 TaxID=3060155 RepID=UPI00287FEED8|nr:prepilin-type N-terminal cleavage/methylation domain-containing protein [Halomonas sp. DWK9]
MPMERQRGFTLTEVMVAMAMGLLIVIGAGQLFLGTLHTFRHVDTLSRQQEALVFAVSTITHTLRQHGPYNDAGEAFYYLRCESVQEVCRCTLQDMSRAQPLVNFSTPDSPACARNAPVGSNASGGADSLVSLPLGPNGRDLGFYVTQRSALFSPEN